MPRRQKSKHHVCEKCQKARSETQSLKGAQATAAEVEGSVPCPLPEDSPPSSPAPDPSQEPQGASATSSLEAGASGPTSDASGTSQDKKSVSASQAALATLRARRDPIPRQVSKLMQYLLQKLNRKEPITHNALLKFVNRRHKEHFPEILRRASHHLELVFGLELKEVNTNSHVYAFFNKLGLPIEGDLSSDEVLPKTGFVMLLLGVIFMKGNRATEEEIWKFLDALGIYPGKNHPILGEPRTFITNDLVQQKQLVCHQMPDSQPPSYVFLWGPKAHAETSKMKVLEVLAKLNNKAPSAFPSLYQEALTDEEDKAWLRAAVMVGPFTKATTSSRAKSCSSSHV
ncbi:PREDICTED: melanoma-associated antigen B1-like [Miniopterus natalensis]|uniref:melanoma-associated antigen B1-like n=1 Tax=Miniopterus natalensis TaxID=291302 RepID=UPI0007A700F2|nr:PREDICTED: melanoma-associated antigen B1-like [Miniopterus natalensis]